MLSCVLLRKLLKSFAAYLCCFGREASSETQHKGLQPAFLVVRRTVQVKCMEILGISTFFSETCCFYGFLGMVMQNLQRLCLLFKFVSRFNNLNGS